MNYRYAFLLFFAAFILQSTILKHLAVFGVKPDLILVLVIVLAFLFRENYAVTCGTIFGLVQDICFSQIIGTSALCYFAVAMFVTEVKRFIYRDNLLSTLFLVIMTTVLYCFLYWGFLRIFDGNYSVMRVIMTLPVRICYNFVLTVILQGIIVRRVIRYRGDHYI